MLLLDSSSAAAFATAGKDGDRGALLSCSGEEAATAVDGGGSETERFGDAVFAILMATEVGGRFNDG